MAKSSQAQAKRNQKRNQAKTHLLQGIQDAQGILPPDTPDSTPGASQPAQQEPVVFLLYRDLELSAGDLRPSAIRSDWAVPVGAARNTLADRVDILKHYLKVLPQEQEPDPSTAAQPSTSASESIERFLDHLFRLYNNHLLMYGAAFREPNRRALVHAATLFRGDVIVEAGTWYQIPAKANIRFMRFALPLDISSPPTLESPRKAALSIDTNNTLSLIRRGAGETYLATYGRVELASTALFLESMGPSSSFPVGPPAPLHPGQVAPPRTTLLHLNSILAQPPSHTLYLPDHEIDSSADQQYLLGFGRSDPFFSPDPLLLADFGSAPQDNLPSADPSPSRILEIAQAAQAAEYQRLASLQSERQAQMRAQAFHSHGQNWPQKRTEVLEAHRGAEQVRGTAAPAAVWGEMEEEGNKLEQSYGHAEDIHVNASSLVPYLFVAQKVRLSGHRVLLSPSAQRLVTTIRNIQTSDDAGVVFECVLETKKTYWNPPLSGKLKVKENGKPVKGEKGKIYLVERLPQNWQFVNFPVPLPEYEAGVLEMQQ
ncbi:hypothetical protein JCM11641_002506 [Rhodosporidiobolus odoratus]